MEKPRYLFKRRGYFFLIDSLLALGILAIGTILIFTFYLNVPSREGTTILSEDLMDFFANNKIKDIDNSYAGLGGTLWQAGEITQADNSLLQQIAEFYKNDKENTAEQFILELTQNVIPSQYKFEVWIDNLRIYPQTTTPSHDNSKKSTLVLIPSKRIVYGILNKQTGELFGPYESEVLVWQ